MKSNYKQLIGILLTGFSIIILMLLLENAGIGSIASIGEENGNSFQELQTEINKIPNNNWDPSGYSTLAAKIHTSKANGFITADVEIDLQKKLDLYYLNKVLETTERYLHTSSGDYGKIIKAINQIISINSVSSEDKAKITTAKSKMEMLKNYTEYLPQRIEEFIRKDYDEFCGSICLDLIRQIDNPNPILLQYSNNPKFQSVKNSKSLVIKYQGDVYANLSNIPNC